ncbi:MAG: hypothetical protein HY216_11505 [Candidatus Rokubacteria bacterium]|nr:hypothetical protein [Candidatus Rokubacteria bacterium]
MSSAADTGRVVVLDSVTHLDRRVGADDVIVAGSFAGELSLAIALEHGVRAVVAHEAGPGLDAAGISGLPFAERFGVAAAAVATMSARIGDGASVLDDGVITHANAPARALGVTPGLAARAAAARLMAAPRGRRHGAGSRPLVDRGVRIADTTAQGRVALIGSMSFAEGAVANDVVCAGSHAGAANVPPILRLRPRGVLLFDGGIARDRSGVSGLPLLDAADVAAAAVGADSARIGDPASLWETGIVSACNLAAEARGVRIGQPAREAARAMLGGA